MKYWSSWLVAGAVLVAPASALAAPPPAAAGSEMPAVSSTPLAAPLAATAMKPPAVPAERPAAPAASPAAAPARTAAVPPRTAAPARAATGKATDHVELDQTTITGNRELPNVMVIVPWKESAPGEPGKAGSSLLDEALEPLDREEFRRELQYDQALQAKPVAPSVATTPNPHPSSP